MTANDNAYTVTIDRIVQPPLIVAASPGEKGVRVCNVDWVFFTARHKTGYDIRGQSNWIWDQNKLWIGLARREVPKIHCSIDEADDFDGDARAFIEHKLNEEYRKAYG